MRKEITLIAVLVAQLLFCQIIKADDVWSEDFATTHNKGYWGSNVDMEGITRWSLDVNSCTLSDDQDYVKVVETSGGRLQAVDCDGEAIWESESIDISKYSTVDLSVLVAETGSSENESKYIKLFYSIDGGELTLFAVNGESTGNWGSVTSSTDGLSGNTLQLVARMNNPNSGDAVYIDNVFVTGDPLIIPVDSTSLVQSPSLSVDPVILRSDKTTEQDAVEVFRFVLRDPEEGDDGEPTHVSQLRIDNSHPPDGASFDSNLAGFVLYANDEKIDFRDFVINADTIYFHFDQHQLVIPDDQSVELRLYCYLNSSGIEDGKKLQFKIGGINHGLKSYEGGSSFCTEQDEFVSSLHSLQVEASRLHFSFIPVDLVRGIPFSVEVEAIDQNGNRDLEFSDSVTLSLVHGDGHLNSDVGLNQLPQQGLAKWDDLYYDSVGDVVVRACSQFLKQDDTPTLVFEAVKSGDARSVVFSPADTMLSSLMISMEQARELFRFEVRDLGDDNLATLIKRVRICAGENNSIDWKSKLEGLQVLENGVVSDVSVIVESNYIDLLFDNPDHQGLLGEGESREFSVYTHFGKGGLVDGAHIQMCIDSLHNGWEVLDEGSDWKECFDGQLEGPLFTIDVKATCLSFDDVVERVGFQEHFAVRVNAEDLYGNVDTDVKETAQLSLATGNGILSFTTEREQYPLNGSFLWEGVSYDKAENFTLLAESEKLGSALSRCIYGSDRTSQVVAAENSEVVESLSSVAVSQEKALKVFNFVVRDEASHDLLPTIITTLRIENANPGGAFSWKRDIGGAVLIDGDKVIARASQINDDEMRFSSSSGVVTVDNGQERMLSLAVWFRETGLADGETFQCIIPRDVKGWKTQPSGSALASEFVDDILGCVKTLNVKATHLWITKLPLSVDKAGDPFSFEVIAGDCFRNTDREFSSDIDVNMVEGDGSLQLPQSLNMQDGKLMLNDVKYTGDGDFRMGVSSSPESVLADTAYIYMNEKRVWLDSGFENRELEGWKFCDEWTVSSYNPLCGRYSLKHNLTQQNGCSNIMYPLKDIGWNEGMLVWRIILHNGNWNPSRDNCFVFYLLSEGDDPLQANRSYGVGVNKQGSSDLLTLWRFDMGEKPQTLLESNINWTAGDSVAFEVIHEANGLWTLNMNRHGSFDNLYTVGAITDQEGFSWLSPCMGLSFDFTATRAGELWADDISLIEISTPAGLETITPNGNDSLLLCFSEALDSLTGKNTDLYKLYYSGELVQFRSSQWGDNYRQVILLCANPLRSGTYRLQIDGVCDQQGDIVKDLEKEFEFRAKPNPYDVVINEIMADPDPAVGLPEYEFVELFNKLDHSVGIGHWSVDAGKGAVEIPVADIDAGGFIILCSASAVEQFSLFGMTVGVPGFPVLNNGGGRVIITDCDGNVIDHVSYSDKWYGNQDKENGGWSLERIDPLRTHGGIDNWSVSEAAQGGTPGHTNSIREDNPDLKAPFVESIIVMEPDKLEVQFSEPVDTILACDINSFNVDHGVGNPSLVEVVNTSGSLLRLLFDNSWSENIRYEISFDEGIRDYAGNYLEHDNWQFAVATEAKPGDVIINEILFNPFPGQVDFVELINVSDKMLDLEQLSLANRNGSFIVDDHQQISNFPKLWDPGKLLLLTTDSAVVAQQYLCSDPSVFFIMRRLPPFADDIGRVLVINSGGDIIDEVAYSDKMHFGLLKSCDGVSLERINPTRPSMERSNWHSAAQTVGFATPGRPNSVYRDDNPADMLVQVTPKLFTPDCDGVDDQVEILFSVEESGWVANVSVFDSQGHEVRRLMRNRLLGVHERLAWDGLIGDDKKAPIGIYIIYVELFNPEGKVDSMKKVCVLGAHIR